MKLVLAMLHGEMTDYTGIYFVGALIFALNALLMISDNYVRNYQVKPDKYDWGIILFCAAFSTVILHLEDVCVDPLVPIAYTLMTTLVCFRVELPSFVKNAGVVPAWRSATQLIQIMLYVIGVVIMTVYIILMMNPN